MKITIISILVVAALIGGVLLFTGDNTGSQSANNVSMIDGKQIIQINAKGGYLPRVTNAKAGVSTIIKINTRSTFDCSSALIIPSLNYRKNLPPTGETLIDLSPQEAGSVLQGLCAMGMYNFQIRFN